MLWSCTRNLAAVTLDANGAELLISLEIAPREQPQNGDYVPLATLKVIYSKCLSDKLQMADHLASRGNNFVGAVYDSEASLWIKPRFHFT